VEVQSEEYNTHYLDFQIEWSQSLVHMNKYGSRAGYVDIGQSKRVAGDLYDYFAIVQIVEHSGMSLNDANELLEVIKKICERHGTQCPVPSEYRTLKDTVLKKIKYRTLGVSKMNLKYPYEMFGELIHQMKPMSFVFVDIALIIAEKLLTITAGKVCNYISISCNYITF